jgi:hypothetical protein
VSRQARRAALAAIARGLSAADRELLDAAPDEVRVQMADIVATGQATAKQAAEAWARMSELADAAEAGEIDPDDGIAVMVTLAHRHRDGGGAD